MTIEEIVSIAALAGKDKPLGDPYLDGLFNLADTAIYYRFLYHLISKTSPELVVELGVCTGRCTAHIAAASPACAVIAIDVTTHEAVDICKKYPNIDLRRSTSTHPRILDSVKDGSVDILFIDTTHTKDQVVSEFDAWLPKMKPGGIVLFDDISENVSMVEAWPILQSKAKESVSLPHLHHSGFGATIV